MARAAYTLHMPRCMAANQERTDMAKILDVNNICDALTNANVPGADVLIANLEAATDTAAWALASHLRIDHEDAAYEQGFGGLCVIFRPRCEGDPCPDVIDEGDLDGDWERK
jgi:hypothetical protein